jgi:hypothetical protein
VRLLKRCLTAPRAVLTTALPYHCRYANFYDCGLTGALPTDIGNLGSVLAYVLFLSM